MGRVKQIALIGCGTACVAVGAIGVFLPILPDAIPAYRRILLRAEFAPLL